MLIIGQSSSVADANVLLAGHPMIYIPSLIDLYLKEYSSELCLAASDNLLISADFPASDPLLDLTFIITSVVPSSHNSAPLLKGSSPLASFSRADCYTAILASTLALSLPHSLPLKHYPFSSLLNLGGKRVQVRCKNWSFNSPSTLDQQNFQSGVHLSREEILHLPIIIWSKINHIHIAPWILARYSNYLLLGISWLHLSWHRTESLSSNSRRGFSELYLYTPKRRLTLPALPSLYHYTGTAEHACQQHSAANIIDAFLLVQSRNNTLL
jgi:hypothetical protein